MLELGVENVLGVGVWYYYMVLRIMEKEKRKNEAIKYQVFTIRLNSETKEKFIQRRIKSGKSWNLFLLDLLNKK